MSIGRGKLLVNQSNVRKQDGSGGGGYRFARPSWKTEQRRKRSNFFILVFDLRRFQHSRNLRSCFVLHGCLLLVGELLLLDIQLCVVACRELLQLDKEVADRRLKSDEVICGFTQCLHEVADLRSTFSVSILYPSTRS